MPESLVYEFRIISEPHAQGAEVTYAPKACLGCDREFYPNHPRSVFCDGCELWAECTNCFEFYKVPKRSTIKLKLVSGEAFCSRSCAWKFKSGSMTCDVHGYQERSLVGKRCAICHNKARNTPMACDVHGYREVSLAGNCGLCWHGPIVCDTHGEQKSSSNSKCRICIGFFGSGTVQEFCDICDALTGHVGDRCGICDPWKEGFQPNWYYSTPDCETHLDELKQALVSGTYECWSCIKERFLTEEYNKLELGFFISTYRVNEDSSAGQFMMEEELVDRSIGWFVYIKGYIKDREWTPLVVGKTGSRATNKTGTDIQFRYDGDQLGRTFLRESELLWDTSKVLIVPCESEEGAYQLESEIAIEHRLFFS